MKINGNLRNVGTPASDEARFSDVLTDRDVTIDLTEAEFEADRLPLAMVRVTDSKGRIATTFLSAKPTKSGIEFTMIAKTNGNHDEVKRKATATFAEPIQR